MKEIDLSVFPPERKEKLENIYRYHSFDVLFYRSNLWMHTHRVLWLLEEIAPFAEKYIKFDLEKARVYALVHDDAEMITGDIQAVSKSRMTQEETVAHESREKEAIEILAEKYPKEIHGYSYKELLEDALTKRTIESQLVSYLDKIDSYCESLHEVYAGNITLLRSVTFNAYIFPTFGDKYPTLKELLSSKESPLTYLQDMISPFEIRSEKYREFNKPHTENSVLITTDYPFYQTWKKIVMEKGKMDWLIKQREFFK